MGFSLEEGLVVVVLVTEIDGPTHAHTQMGKQYSGMMAMYCDDSDGGRTAPAETLHHSFHRWSNCSHTPAPHIHTSFPSEAVD